MLEPRRFSGIPRVSPMLPRARARTMDRRKAPATWLRCEALEDRRLLAITVDTLLDELDSSLVDGDISLRDAIAVATPGETIDFDMSLNGGKILLTLGELTITDALTIDATALTSGLRHKWMWSRIACPSSSPIPFCLHKHVGFRLSRPAAFR